MVFLQTRQNVFTREEEKTQNTEELQGTCYNVFVRQDRIGFWSAFFLAEGRKPKNPEKNLPNKEDRTNNKLAEPIVTKGFCVEPYG